jgi:hypothetical protein
MMTTFGKFLMKAMTVGVFAGLISFSVCHRAHEMEYHGTEAPEIRLEMGGERQSSLRSITPASKTRGALIAFDGGGTYGG